MITEKEKKEAEKAMLRALTPRDKNGLLVPVVSCKGPPEELYYPYLEPDENGLVPAMFGLEEFADGKTPSCLKYAPGFQRDYISVDDPRYMDSIRYNDPYLNLSHTDQHRIKVWNEKLGTSLNVQVTGKQPEVINQHANTELDPDVRIINNPEGTMTFKTAFDETLLANFSIEAVEHRLVHTSNKEDDIVEEYEIKVKTKGAEKSLIIAPKDIDNIVGIIQKAMPMCAVCTCIKKPNAFISNHVRKQLFELPERHHVKVSGFIQIAGKWVFSHDGAQMPGSNVSFHTGRTIPVDTSMTPRDAFRYAMEFLSISAKLMLMLPLILLAHLSPMFNLFEAAGHVPRFVTALIGRSGSLKTSLALELFRLFQEQSTSPEANFKDTEVALEMKLGDGNGKVMLLDDYRPPVTAVDGKNNLVKFESVIRAAGDRVGKSRSNPTLGKAKEYLPTCCALITGEDLGGTHSSYLRLLILPISKGDIDGQMLKRFQDNPLLFTTHMAFFLKWAGDNADSIIDFIKMNFDKDRSFYAGSLKEPRVIDTAATLMLTAQILHSYGVDIGAIVTESSVQLLNDWRYAILQATIVSEGISKEQDPVSMYLQAFFDLWERKEIEISRDIKSYVAGTHIGYAVEDNLWLWHREVYTHVCRYWQKLGILFPLTCEKVNEHLDSAGLIKPCYETRGTGKKKLFVCKSSLPGRGRMLVLNEPLSRNYVENASD